MRISKQVSGSAALRDEEANQGRGEYEWVDLQSEDPTPGELLNRRILLRLADDIVLDTAGEFEIQGGKRRIRTAADARASNYIYPMYHLAVALLMPCPRREEPKAGSGRPILRSEEYVMRHIFCGPIRLQPNSAADITVLTVWAANRAVPDGEDAYAANRFSSIRRIWENRAKLPPEMGHLLEEHEVLVRSGDQISIKGRKLVREIQKEAALTAMENEAIGWATPSTDPLPVLMDLLGLAHSELPLRIDDILPEDRDIRRLEIARQRRLVAVRGPESARFRRRVRNAYRITCVVCGLWLPSLWENGRAGVDAAHILPYSEYDLNDVSNGVCLCKLHHWAFDEGIIEIRHDPTSGYSVVIPQEAERKAAGPPARMDLNFLRRYVGSIPVERLPAKVIERPRPEYLRRLRDMLFPP